VREEIRKMGGSEAKSELKVNKTLVPTDVVQLLWRRVLLSEVAEG
jgi:hypothetical protein